MAGTTLVLKEENLVVLENVEKSVYEELLLFTAWSNSFKVCFALVIAKFIEASSAITE